MISIELSNFLLAIAKPMIHELTVCTESEICFEQACYASRLFSSFVSASCHATEVDEASKVVFNATENFLLSYCRCCDIDKEKYRNYFLQYLDTVLPIVFDNVQIKTENLSFLQDYKNIQTSLLAHEVTIDQAQKSLNYWRGAIDEQVLLNALVQLTYTYIKQIQERQYSDN